MNIKDYNESIKKRRGIQQWCADISYKEQIVEGTTVQKQHNLYANNKEALMVKVQEYKQQIGLV